MSKHNIDGVNVSIEELIHLKTSLTRTKLKHHKDIRTTQSGNILSKIKGHGIDFDEVRQYQFGDDIRSIDWKTSAKLQKTYSKTYKEERERPVLILVDLHRDMFFGTRVGFKSVIATRLATLIAYLADYHQDRVGGVIYGEQMHLECKPKAGKSGLQTLIKSLVHIHQSNHQKPDSKTKHQETPTLELGLMRIKRVIKPGSLLFVLSDFAYFSNNSQSILQQIGKHNDIILSLIFDPIEKTAPKSGQYLINAGQSILDKSTIRLLNTRKKAIKQQYEQIFTEKQHKLMNFCQENRQSLLNIATNDDLEQVLFNELSIFSTIYTK